MPIVTVTPKGQVMIPAAYRKQFGIKPGRKVAVEAEGDLLILRPLPEDPVEALYGILSEAPPTPATQFLLEEEDYRREQESQQE